MDEEGLPLVGIEYGGMSAASLYQNRLVLAGGGSIGDLVLASKSEEWDDFSTGTLDRSTEVVTTTDADGFWFQQVSATNVTFHAMAQQEGLFIFGDIAESYVPAGPFTAAQAEVRSNSAHGSDIGRSIVIAGSQVLFLQRDGRDLRMLDWTEEQRKYLAPSALTLSGNVFGTARDMTYEASRDLYADQVYVIGEPENRNRSVIGVASLKDIPPRIAWTKWETQGAVLAVTSVLGNTVFLVERLGEVGLERLDESRTLELDAAIVFDGGVPPGPPLGPNDPTVEWNGPWRDHIVLPYWMRGSDLEVKLYWRVYPPNTPIWENSDIVNIPIIVDNTGFPRADVETDLNEYQARLAGVGRLPDPEPGSRVEVGIEFYRDFETLPFIARTGTGNKLALRHSRIMDIGVDTVVEGDVSERRYNFIEYKIYDPHQLGTNPQDSSIPDEDLGWGNWIRPWMQDPKWIDVWKAEELARDTDHIFRLEPKDDGVRGWRDRNTIKMRFRHRVDISGVTYRAVG